MLSLDSATLAEYTAGADANARAQAVIDALTGTVTVKVYDGSDTLKGSGTMSAPWATRSAADIVVGEVASFAVSSSGTPDANWYLRFESATRWVRGSFGLAGSGQDFRWSLGSWASGQAGNLGTVVITAHAEGASQELQGQAVITAQANGSLTVNDGNTIIPAERLIDWTASGIAGGIPVRATISQTVDVAYGNDATDARAHIQGKIDATTEGQVCYIPAGTYRVNGALNVKSGITIRGAGKGLTIIKAMGSATGLFQFGTDSILYTNQKTISSGSTAGSTSIVLNNTTGITTSSLLLVSELNDASYPVSNDGTANTPAAWVDGWASNGMRARGQIVKVTAINGNTVSFTPALYTTYSLTPWANYATPSVTNAGVESLTVYATNSGTTANFHFGVAEQCWIYDIYSDFTDLNHVNMSWSYRCQIDKCHFYDGFDHTGECNVSLRYKSSACLVQNSVFERLLVGIYVSRGSAGNVVAYNYFTGGYNDNIATGTRYLVNDIEPSHSGHPHFNLIEGNVLRKSRADSYWGTSSDSLYFRNYISGFGQGRLPVSARGALSTAYDLIQANRCLDVYEGQRNYAAVGNVLGNKGNWASRSPVRKRIDPQSRAYDNPPYVITLGYMSSSDGGGTALMVNPSGTFIDHGNWDSVTNGVVWDPAISDHSLRSSYAYSAKPAWWPTGMAWPSIDPLTVPADLTTITNPAKYRYDFGEGTAVNTFGHFEGGTEGQSITTANAKNFFSGTNASLVTTSTGDGVFSAGSVSNLTVQAASAHAVDTTLNVGGVPVSTSIAGLKVGQGSNGVLFIDYLTTANPAMAYHFRWTGAQINSSPRDIAGWWNTNGHFQILQAYDGASPYLHIHYQPPYTMVGNNITIQKNHWYWLRQKWASPGGTTYVEVYDAQNNYALVGTSSGTVDSTSAAKPRYLMIGMIRYSSGASQYFDFDNIIINWDGTLPPIPGA